MDRTLETCPITPLGMSPDRSICYYRLADENTVVSVPLHRHGKLVLYAMFGPAVTWLEKHFPRWSKPVREQIDGKWKIVKEAEVIGFDQERVAEWLVIQSATIGAVTLSPVEAADG